MDPISFWMQASVFWLKVFKQQQDSYLRVIGAFAEKMPHEDSRQLSAEAEAMKNMLKPAARKTATRRPAAKTTPRGASRAQAKPAAKSAAATPA
ncbi:MAG: hypothetical protein JJT99_00415 [Rhodobacteraceae bacterium]|nr:hypothetical protein [Paracoccaceae bacterium]